LINFCITEAVRTVHSQATDTDIGNSISKWLAQGTVRVQRQYVDYISVVYNNITNKIFN